MLDNGYTREYAERTFRQLEGFGSYGFPESHAASFALIAFASSWMKCHHPDVSSRRRHSSCAMRASSTLRQRVVRAEKWVRA
jgi:hypothetical protein